MLFISFAQSSKKRETTSDTKSGVPSSCNFLNSENWLSRNPFKKPDKHTIIIILEKTLNFKCTHYSFKLYLTLKLFSNPNLIYNNNKNRRHRTYEKGRIYNIQTFARITKEVSRKVWSATNLLIKRKDVVLKLSLQLSNDGVHLTRNQKWADG